MAFKLKSTSRILASLFALFNYTRAQSYEVTVDWDNIVMQLKTTSTLQSVVVPDLLTDSPIHDKALQALSTVSSDYVRFVPWYPHPVLAVVELDEPSQANGQCTTSWDFTYADQLLGDFLNSTQGVKHIINFSTTPAWMWVTDSPVPYSTDPNEINFNYSQGTRLRDETFAELAGYFQRMINWWVNGGFTDECGVYHASGHNWPIEYWEFLNEPEAEHNLTPEYYTQLYDAVTAAIHEVAPNIKFVGLALFTRNTSWPQYFLDANNHNASSITAEFISYHFYAGPAPDASQETMSLNAFAQADTFLTEVQAIETIRKNLSPNTKTTLNELGTVNSQFPLPAEYWAWSGGIFAYLFAKTALLGIDVVGESQLIGYPGQNPDVSMIDWDTGDPLPRLWVLQLLQSEFAVGDNMLATNTSDETVFYSQAFSTSSGRKILMINKTGEYHLVQVPFASSIAKTVDDRSGSGPAIVETVDPQKGCGIQPFSVVVVEEVTQ